MAIIRSINFPFNNVEELVDNLHQACSGLSYSKQQEYLQMTEHMIFHPNITQLGGELSSLKEKFKCEVKKVYTVFGLNPRPRPFYSVLSRTYRQQHEDFYLCATTLGLNVRNEEVLIKKILMNYDEQHHSLNPPHTDIRLTLPNDEDILDLRKYLAERLK